MSFSYTPSFLSAASSVTSNLHKVRFMTGDTDSTWALMSDDEIWGVLTSEPIPTYAAAIVCDGIAASFARQANFENSALRVSAAVRMKHYLDLADRLRAGGPGDMPGNSTYVPAEIYVGGAEVSAKEALTADTDLVQPAAKLGQDDFPDVDSDIDSDFTGAD